MSAEGLNGTLIQTLRGFGQRAVTVLINWGNRGDGVIHMGGRQLLARLGIRAREVREMEVDASLAGDVLLVFGGGAYARGTNTLPRLLPRVAARFQEVVLLPSSFDLESPAVRRFAQSWGMTYTIFCRELVSFDALRAAGVRPKALLLGHDLAFHADLSSWAARPHSGTTGVFRRDNEACYGALPMDMPNEDVSHGPDTEPERLLDYVSRFSVIHTDRCHAAVTAAIMGREVHFYRNNYFKNQAIYDQSLAAYPNVTFVPWTRFSIRQFARAVYWSRLRPLEMKFRSAVLRQRRGASRPAA